VGELGKSRIKQSIGVVGALLVALLPFITSSVMYCVRESNVMLSHAGRVIMGWNRVGRCGLLSEHHAPQHSR